MFLKSLIYLSKFLIFIYKNWINILTAIGNIKIFNTPFYILYDPREYDYKIRGYQIRHIKSLLKPGDIILRKYDHYLDGFLIPGKYSHSSLYIGNNTIIHAVAEGVKKIDLIDFCQCDGICVLRCKNEDVSKQAIINAKLNLGKPYDFKFNTNDSSEFYCHELVRTCFKDLNIESYYPSLFNIALKFLDKRYLDKSFLENKNFNKIIEI